MHGFAGKRTPQHALTVTSPIGTSRRTDRRTRMLGRSPCAFVCVCVHPSIEKIIRNGEKKVGCDACEYGRIGVGDMCIIQSKTRPNHECIQVECVRIRM